MKILNQISLTHCFFIQWIYSVETLERKVSVYKPSIYQLMKVSDHQLNIDEIITTEQELIQRFSYKMINPAPKSLATLISEKLQDKLANNSSIKRIKGLSSRFTGVLQQKLRAEAKSPKQQLSQEAKSPKQQLSQQAKSPKQQLLQIQIVQLSKLNINKYKDPYLTFDYVQQSYQSQILAIDCQLTETFTFKINEQVEHNQLLHITLWDDDIAIDDCIAKAEIKLDQIDFNHKQQRISFYNPLDINQKVDIICVLQMEKVFRRKRSSTRA